MNQKSIALSVIKETRKLMLKTMKETILRIHNFKQDEIKKEIVIKVFIF